MNRLFFSLLVLTCLFGMAPVQAAGAQKKDKEEKKETEFSEKIDELNQETDTLLEEIDKWQM